MIISNRTTLGLRATAAICALIGLAALVAQILHLMPMVFSLTFFGVPSILLLFALAAIGRYVKASVFLNCLIVGLIGGLVATLCYDGVRLLIRTTHILNYDGFATIYIFGSWITSQAPTTTAAAIAGWVYHFWNGLSFGVFYTLTFGRRRWIYGVGYGVFMEACMLGLFPLFLAIPHPVDFVVASMFGHAVYGGTLGLISQKYALRW